MLSMALVLLLESISLEERRPPAGPGEWGPAESRPSSETFRLSDGTYVATTEAAEVVVARIGADGKPVIACVDNARAMQRFLDRGKQKASEK